MIKTLRITTIIAAILAVGFFAFPAVFGFRGDEQIEQFLKSPGAIEKFNKAKGAKLLKTGDQISPLVKQAAAFGLYLNPPPKPKPKPKTPTVRKPSLPPPDPVKTTAKFTLIGTSYYASRPELSLAYIDEPGKGFHWVRQGSKVSHLVIEQVKDGSIVVKDRERTVTLVAVRPPKKSLIKGQTTSKSTPALPGASASITSGTPLRVSAGQSPASDLGKPSASITSGGPRQPSPEETAMMEKLVAELSAMGADAEAGKTDSQHGAERGEALLGKFISDLEARITTEEAKRLDRLGKELRYVQRDPNRARSLKLGRSRRESRPPRRPPR